MPEAESLGFMYIARHKCGRVTAMCWDDAGYEKSTADAVAGYIKRGNSVERVERFESAPLPPKDEWMDDACRAGECAPLTPKEAP
jgi:hypothetical protein